MSFLFFDPKSASNLKKSADAYLNNNDAELDPESDEFSMPATFFDKQIPVMPTAKEIKNFQKANILDIQENTQKEQSPEQLALKQIETNVVKECIDKGFYIKKDEDGLWPMLQCISLFQSKIIKIAYN